MTPVQLPEVPAPVAVYCVGTNVEIAVGEHLYTATQLREYATEAVMANSPACIARLLAKLDERVAETKGACDGSWISWQHETYKRLADDLRYELEVAIPSETNNER